MITILPMDDAAKKQAVLANYPQAGGLADVIVMEEKELEYGSAVLSVEGTVLKIYDIAVCGQSLSALDMTGKFVADIEYGDRGVSLKNLYKLKQILSVSIYFLMDG